WAAAVAGTGDPADPAGTGGRPGPPRPLRVDPGPTPGSRDAALEGGGRLVVRDATADGVDGLAALYDRLSSRDRRLRFFSEHRPSVDFLRAMVGWRDRGGCVLVAEAHDGHGPPTLAADVWCAAPVDGE